MSGPQKRPQAMEFRSVRLSAVEAEVQVLWRGDGAPADLAGWASGPMSSTTKTVPSRFRLLPPRPDDPATRQAEDAARQAARIAGVPEEPSPSVVGRFVIADPCYWRPGAPYLYRVRLDSAATGLHVDDALGLRWLETSGGRLRCGGEPWFLETLQPDFYEYMNRTSLPTLQRFAALGLIWAPAVWDFEALGWHFQPKDRGPESFWNLGSHGGLGLIADGAAFSSLDEFLRAAAEPSVLLVQNAPPAAAERMSQLDGPLVADRIEGESFDVRPSTALAGVPGSAVRIRRLAAWLSVSLDTAGRLALRQETEGLGCGGWLGELGDDAVPTVRGFEELAPRMSPDGVDAGRDSELGGREPPAAGS